MISELTPEQEALIPVYRDKWRAIALSTERIDRQKAAEAVKAAYTANGKKEPEILFCDSPYKGCLEFISLSQSKDQALTARIPFKVCGDIYTHIIRYRINQIYWQLARRIEPLLNSTGISYILEEQLLEDLEVLASPELKTNFFKRIEFPELATRASYSDFCISVLNYKNKKMDWEAFQLLVENCGWVFPFEKTCIVCDRPTKLSLDNEDRPHAEGEPAIEYADGWSIYSYHGLRLPEKYARLHPHQWRSEWLLEEKNASLRRILILEIGYARICQELKAVELDSWHEYTLLGIDNEVDIETIYLLKMTCPSTGHIHVLRVPPDVNSAREAIRWVNWGIDPEEFAVQT